MFVTTDWIIQKCVCVDVAKQIFDTLSISLLVARVDTPSTLRRSDRFSTLRFVFQLATPSVSLFEYRAPNTAKVSLLTLMTAASHQHYFAVLR